MKPLRMFSSGGVVDVQEVDLQWPWQFTAFVSSFMLDPWGGFGWDNAIGAEVYEVDGSKTDTSSYNCHWGPKGSDSNMHAPIVVRYGQRIPFRARTIGNCDLSALGVVFYE